eukprot:TRINITY_DN48945_c0_g1_i1.p1 TRINITY_DN48945_c0_g1~~TRINITY_DN48945_c0_g1_i1.p1  ORF type:complete len:173 (+),score=22.41 TRINITY_DN48945_c0_g1_i1:173-691(+)
MSAQSRSSTGDRESHAAVPAAPADTASNLHSGQSPFAPDQAQWASGRPQGSADDCTVFLRNVPVRCRSDEVLASLAGLGFDEHVIATFTMPSRPGKPSRKSHNRGYCFVRFVSPEICRRFIETAKHGFHIESRSSEKLVTVERVRGLPTEAVGSGTAYCMDDSELQVLELSL